MISTSNVNVKSTQSSPSIFPSDYVSSPSNKKSTPQIPNSSQTVPSAGNESVSAPDSSTSLSIDTATFTTILRNKRNRKKTCKLSPHSYYRQSSHKKLTESSSSKLSAFTQLNNILRSATMSSQPSPTDPNPPTPEDDTMDTTAVTPDKSVAPSENLTDAQTESIIQEFTSHEFTNPSTKPQPQDNLSPSAQHVSSNIRPTFVKPSSINVGMFTSVATSNPKPDLSSPPTIAQQNSTGTMKVSHIEKNIIIFRYRLKVTQSSCNLPFMVKQVTRMLREIDPSLHILPIDSSNCNHVLDHEDNLPNEENALNTWVSDISTWKDRLQFTMKYAFIKTLPYLKGPVFAWMKANSSFVKMDKIDSADITCVGFFEGLHPDFRNRELFKQFCNTHVKNYMQSIDPTFTFELSIFPRGVYAGAGIHKKETRGVVLEVATDISETILQAFSQPFPSQYSDITFIPFTKTDETYSQTLSSIITHQNEMLHKTRRKILPELKDLYSTITTKEGRATNLHEWLSSASDPSIPNEKLIKSIDLTTKNSVCILFDEAHDNIISKLLQGMHIQMQQCFPDTEIQKVLDPTRKISITTPTRVISETEKTWVDIIKRKYASNPQSTDMDSLNTPPPKNRKVIYYGPCSKPAQLNANTFDIKSTETPSADTNDNTSRIEKLEKTIETMATNQQAQITQSVSSMEQKLVLRINQNNDKINNRMDLIENSFSKMTDLFSSNFDRITNKLDQIANNSAPPPTGHLHHNESTTATAAPGFAGGKHQ